MEIVIQNCAFFCPIPLLASVEVCIKLRQHCSSSSGQKFLPFLVLPPVAGTPPLPDMVDGVGGQNTVPEANIPEELLPNARPGTLYGVSVDWWTLELGILGTGFPGVPFN
jgi:hypothetical protein